MAVPTPAFAPLTAVFRPTAPADTTPVPLDLPRLGVVLHVRRLNGAGYRDYLADVRAADGGDDTAVVLAHALGDPAGGRLFLDYRQVPTESLTAGECQAVRAAFVRLNLPDPVATRAGLADPVQRMLHRLALACGTWDVDAVAAAVPPAALAGWLAFFEREPWGGAEDWSRAGEIAAAVYNARPYRKAGSPPVKPGQFGPQPPTPPPTREQAAAKLLAGRSAWAALARGGGFAVVTAAGTPARLGDLMR